MSSADNRSIARRYFEEFWNAHDPSVLDCLVDPHVQLQAGMSAACGVGLLKERLRQTLALYSNPHFEILDIIAQSAAGGDRVAVRWRFTGRHTGRMEPFSPEERKDVIRPNGREIVTTGINIFQIQAGQITAIWVAADTLGELEQLGLIAPASTVLPSM